MKHDYSDILGFFRTGQLDELRLGMTLNEVIDYLGLPPGYDNYTALEKDIERQVKLASKNHVVQQIYWLYGCLSVHFTLDSILSMFAIILYQYPAHQLPAALNSNGLPYFYNMNREAFREFCTTHQLQCYAYRDTSKILELFIKTPEISVIFYGSNDDLLIATGKQMLTSSAGKLW